MNDRLDPDDAGEVLRRASELASTPQDEGGYDRAALAEAAQEVGIERRAVERALAEHDAGLLRRPAARGGLLGPGRVEVARTLALSTAAARGVVDDWLRRQLLERVERAGAQEEWRPRDDLGAKLRRKVDARTQRRVRLKNIDAIRVTVVDAGEGAALVRIEAVFDAMRRGLLTGVVAVPTAVTPVLGVAATVLTGEPTFLVGSIPLAAGLGGLGAYTGRKTLSDEREAARLAITAFLDDVR